MKTRQDSIETDYVDGVYNAKGELVIRPLTSEEKAWLSQFYAETEHENFAKTAEIEEQHELHKELCKKMRNEKRFMTAEERLNLQDEIDAAYKHLVYLRSETNTFYPEDKDRHEIYSKGNARRNDMFNVAKASNRLVSFDLPEFDQFTTRAEKDISPEDLVLDHLIKKPAKKIVRRKRK